MTPTQLAQITHTVPWAYDPGPTTRGGDVHRYDWTWRLRPAPAGIAQPESDQDDLCAICESGRAVEVILSFEDEGPAESMCVECSKAQLAVQDEPGYLGPRVSSQQPFASAG